MTGACRCAAPSDNGRCHLHREPCRVSWHGSHEDGVPMAPASRLSEETKSTMMRAVLFAIVVWLLVACSGPATPNAAKSAPSTSTIASTALAAVNTPTASPSQTTVSVSQSMTSSAPTAILRTIASPIASPAADLGAPGTPTPTNKVKAQLAENVSSDYLPVNPTTTFSTSSPRVYLAFSTTNLPANSTLSSVWVAEKVNANVTPDYVIDKAELNVSGSQSGDFSLSSPTAGFPSGQYRVDLYLDSTLIASYPFTVK